MIENNRTKPKVGSLKVLIKLIKILLGHQETKERKHKLSFLEIKLGYHIRLIDSQILRTAWIYANNSHRKDKKLKCLTKTELRYRQYELC